MDPSKSYSLSRMSACDYYYGKVFAHTAAALGIAATSASYVDVGDLIMRSSHPILIFILNLVVSLILLWGLFATESGGVMKYLFFFALAFFMGQMVQPLAKKLESKNTLARILWLTSGVFVGMMMVGMLDSQNLLGFGPYLMGALVGLLLVHVILALVSPSQFNTTWYSTIGVGLFSVFTAYDTQVIKENKKTCRSLLNRGIQPDYPVQSLSLFLDYLNLFRFISGANSNA